jgi:RES domain-containing protein
MILPARLPETLKKIAPARVDSTLTRRVPLLSLIGHKPLQFLYTSGKPNRFNLPRTNCLYFSDTEATAKAEWELTLVGAARKRPCAVFFARVQLSRVIDLLDPKVCAKLDLSTQEVFAEWRTTIDPIATQILGEAAKAAAFVGIRYPSNAAQLAKFNGANIVIFVDNLIAPDFVGALGDRGETIEQIPG